MNARAIVIGATSGIGRSLAEILSQEGYIVGLAGRREHLLEEVKQSLPNRSFTKRMDVSRTEEARGRLGELVAEMAGADLIIVNAGTASVNPELDWHKEKDDIEVNVAGFTALANAAMHHFIRQGSGHLVGISSIAALRGGRSSPSYYASKAFVSHYLEGLRHMTVKTGLDITVTDIQPGFVDTKLALGDNIFWCASAEKAARQIYGAVRKKKSHAYITKRWRLIAWLMKAAPGFIYYRT
ncbi:MAG: hypothetical protein AMJ79_01575 [Phycisphaerae bacterium SM23_30]|nr:MAG: hypothetical protein AMJ79_01575 [Phycisphaerae bacterium SM23_30]